MAEQTSKTNPTETPRPPSGERGSGQEVLDELGRLGSKLVDVVQAAWTSEERKRIEADLKSGLSAVATSLEEGFEKVRANEQTKELLDKAEDVAESLGEKVSQSKVARDLADGLLKGLRSLSVQIDKVADDLQKKQADEATKESAQDIPVERDA